ncbi:hypothetical protein UPYG_G00188070 [Umbra pygmaea]|uniref:Uncharacterized protein n=1 Tax=Umbra pygmaea TaxID=75934 RepID=A0ABD0WSI7_UMBPY
MPSKRKKSKRRTRRVHAERRIREEQQAAGTGAVKGTLRVPAVVAPPQISKEVPVTSPVIDVVIPEETSVEPPTEQIAAVQEIKCPVIPNTDPLSEGPDADPLLKVTMETQVAPIPEAHVLALESEVQVEDSVAISTEISQMHDKCKDKMEAEIVSEVQTEAEPGPTIEDKALVVEAGVQPEEVVIKTEDCPLVEAEPVPVKPGPELVLEANANIVVEVQSEEVVVKAEDHPVVKAEASPEDVETKMSPVIKEDGPVKTEASEEVRVTVVDPIIDTVADDFVMTESVPSVKAAMIEPIIEKKVLAIRTNEMNALSELLNNVPPVSEPAPVTADEVIDAKEEIEFHVEIKVEDSTDKKTAFDDLSGEFSAPQPISSGLQCHTQLAAAPAPIDIPGEAGLNGHRAAEAAIDG